MTASIKRNTPVRWTRKNGEIAKGKLIGREEKANGEWALVRIEGVKEPAKVRMSQLTPA